MSQNPPHYGPSSAPAGYPPPTPLGAPPPAGTNGFAIAAVILGAVGAWVISVIFGILALNQIRRTGQAGRGLAIAGFVLSGIWAVIVVVVVVVVIAGGAGRNDSGVITAPGSVSATALQAGDCVNGLETGTFSSLPAVPCDSSHEGEAFAVFDLPDGPFPGQATVDEQAQVQCSTRLDAYSPSAIADPEVGLFFVTPNGQTWPGGDREVVCIATAVSGTTTGSIRGR